MTIDIAKNGKTVMTLRVLDDGCCAIQKKGYYSVISPEKFASILDDADKGGLDIFDYYT